jgi:hypothetical protein
MPSETPHRTVQGEAKNLGIPRTRDQTNTEISDSWSPMDSIGVQKSDLRRPATAGLLGMTPRGVSSLPGLNSKARRRAGARRNSR